MPKNILVVDDDADFNSLLTDVFRQADFNVVSVLEPRQAVEVFSRKNFDLVVSDYLMPQMTGVEFIRAIRKIRDDVPVVVVSGFLEKNIIRELLEAEVKGIFLKPLNVFSLLQNSQVFIEEKPANDLTSGEFHRRDLAAQMQSFPCKAAASLDFAGQLYAVRNFQSPLLLMGEKGSQFKRICRDLCRFEREEGERLCFLEPGNITEENLKKDIQKLGAKPNERITLATLHTEGLDKEEKSLIYNLTHKEKSFSDLPGEFRFVFCLTQDLQDILDNGHVDELFHRLLGSSKIMVPPLRDCREDIFFLAQQILKEEAEKTRLSSPPLIEGAAIDFLKNKNWPGNFAELRELLQITLKMCTSPLLEVDAFNKAQNFMDLDPQNIEIDNLQDYVEEGKEGYTGTVYNLLQGDPTKSGNSVEINTALEKEILPENETAKPKG